MVKVIGEGRAKAIPEAESVTGVDDGPDGTDWEPDTTSELPPGTDPGDVLTWDGDSWEPEAPSGGHDDDWFWAVDYGVVADGTTDDTSALQDCIDACSAAGGGTIRLPAGIIQIDGALQSTSTFNSQLTIPLVLLSSGMSVPIRFLGAGPNRIYDGTPGDHETIIRSSWNGTISGHPAVISAGTWRDLTTGRNNTQLRFEDITFVAHDDPKLSMLQLTSASWASFHNVQIRTETVQPAGTYATHSNAVGVEFPFGLSYANEELTNLAIYSFYVGARPSEQTKGYIGFAFCKIGVELVAQQNSAPYIRWPNFTFYWTFVSCDTGIKVTGTGDRWLSGHASFEHDEDATPSWTTTYDIDDASNQLHGILTIHPTDYTDGPTDDLRVNNAQKLSYHWPSQDYWRLNSQVHIPTGTDPSTNPFSGRTIYARASDGHLCVRTVAGSVIDLEAPTPSGAAGGDLSGTYPNPSVVDDSHNHTSATAPGSSARGAILLESGAPIPFTFDDILQASDGSDFLYASA